MNLIYLTLKITLTSLAATVLVFGVFSSLAQASGSQSSSLTQRIKPANCGGAPDCELQPPIITSAANNKHNLTISGKYDQHNALSLRVMFNHKWYILGTDDELSVSGNNWLLALSGAPGLPLPPGTYPIEVQMVTLEGNLMTYTANLTVASPPTDKNPKPKPSKKPDITIMPPSTGYFEYSRATGDRVLSSTDSWMISSFIFSGGLALLVLAWKHNKR